MSDYIKKILVNIEKGLAITTYVLTMEQIDEKLSELQKELMILVRLNARTGLDTQVYSKEYLQGTDTAIEKFDGELFGRLIEKVVVRSLVEVTFVFKTGVEVKELLG